jgi:cytochrome c556
MRSLLFLASAASLVAVAACNSGGEAPPADERAEAANSAAPVDVIAAVMDVRQEHYKGMGKAMKGIGDQLKSDAPSVEAIQRHAALIAGDAPRILTWFPAGSGAESGRKTRAKAEVWTDAATFRERAHAFEAEAGRFNQIAQAGDIAAIRAAQPALGTACKNCHDRFRAPED